MSFIEDLERQAWPIRQAILTHPFVTGIGDGTLDVAKFKYYIMQDYAYLIDYSRVLALGAARAPELATMSWFANLVNVALNVEMDLHRSYCAEFGITAKELEDTRPVPTTIGYTSYLLKVAHQGSFGEYVASLLPCQWGYCEIGEHLARQGEPKGAPLYSQWIQMYSSAEFVELAQHIRLMANGIGSQASPPERAAMTDAYLTSLRWEHRFWDMGYTLESWGV